MTTNRIITTALLVGLLAACGTASAAASVNSGLGGAGELRTNDVTTNALVTLGADVSMEDDGNVTMRARSTTSVEGSTTLADTPELGATTRGSIEEGEPDVEIPSTNDAPTSEAAAASELSLLGWLRIHLVAALGAIGGLAASIGATADVDLPEEGAMTASDAEIPGLNVSGGAQGMLDATTSDAMAHAGAAGALVTNVR